MKLAVFGATGLAGKAFVEQALAAGHDVTAVARDPARLASRERLRAVQGDVGDQESVARAVVGADAVVCAVGPAKGTAAGTVISDAARNIVAGMRAAGVRKLVFTSGLMVGDARGGTVVYRLMMRVFRALKGALYRDKVEAERIVRESGLDWVIVRPPLFDARDTRRAFLLEEDAPLRMIPMSAADVGSALLRALEDPALTRKAADLSYQ